MPTVTRFAFVAIIAQSALACSGPNETAQVQTMDPVTAEQVTAPAPAPLQRVCGCDDLQVFAVPANRCLLIANKIWGSVEDDIACFDLTPDDATCTRTCAGYLTIRTGIDAPMVVAAHSKLGDPDVRLVSPVPGDVDYDQSCFDAAPGIAYEGGPTAATYPPACVNP